MFSAAYAKKKGIPQDSLDWYASVRASDLTNRAALFDERKVRHLDGKPHKEDGMSFCEGVFFFSERQGSVLLDPDAGYRDLSDMADEFRKKFGAYLPDGFDFASHLAEFSGTFVC